MKRVIGVFSSIFSVIHNEINGAVEDKYVSIRAARPRGALDKVEKKIIPFALHSELPDLGPDRDQLIAKAERLFSTDAMRLKWLQSIADMRENDIEWIMETKSGEELKKHNTHARLYPKWAGNPVSTQMMQ